MGTKNPNTILPENTAYAIGAHGPVTNLRVGGPMGYSPDMRDYHAAADYTRRPLIFFLMEAPGGFQDLDNPQEWVAALKSLIELHPRSVTGFDQSLEVDYVETPYGGAGEVMETLAKVKRARSQPTWEWVEKIGCPIKYFWNSYILNLLGNPETNVPAVVARGKNTPYGLYPDYTTFTVMALEPDPTQRFVVEAWLVTNLSPKNGPKVEGSRDITETPQNVTQSISFTCLQQVGNGVRKLAQRMLDACNQTGIDPNNRPAFIQDVEADVAREEVGYAEQMKELGKLGSSL